MSRTYVQRVSPNRATGFSSFISLQTERRLPAMCECFYVEAQGGAYTHDVLAVELLHDRRFTCVVETAVKISQPYRVC